MMSETLAPGFYDTDPATIATIVTSLEMLAKTPPRPERSDLGLQLTDWPQPSPDEYRAIFRRIGEDWLWSSRLLLDDDALAAIIHDPRVRILRLHAPAGIGLLELDFRRMPDCELAFLGLSHELQSSGAGRWLMNRAISLAWDQPITRLWVHTCTLDHPAAVGFYRRSGFTPFRRQVEIMKDPRLTGMIRRDAGPHIPCLPG